MVETISSSRQIYTQEFPLEHLKPAQYFAIAQKAGSLLPWYLIQTSGDKLVFRTPESGYSMGELVTLSISGKTATIESRSVNEYYANDAQNQANIALLNDAIQKVAAEEERRNRNLHPMHREKYGALVISKTYLITPLLVYANALVFIAMIIGGVSPLHPTTEGLYVWGGNFRYAVVNGEWWRLLSYMFLHAGGLHLLMNTFALLYIGMFLEPLIGKLRFTAAYILTGVCAGLLSIAMHANSVGVGASGAIFGMYGIFLSILTTAHIQKTMRKTMLRSMLFFVVFNLMMGLQGNTDNAAHIGGLLSGMAIGYAYYRGIKRKLPLLRQAATVLLLSVGVAIMAAVTFAMLA